MVDQPPVDVRPDLWEVVRDILRQHAPQQEVWAFGSRVKSTAKPHSDLDLVIVSDVPMTLEQSTALTDAFAESDLPWRVDVVDWATTSEVFRGIIAKNKVVVQKPSAEPQHNPSSTRGSGRGGTGRAAGG